MALPALFALAFGTGFTGAVAPGPVLFATVRWSARRGRWVGPAVTLGHMIVELPLVVGVVLGLGGLLKADLFVAVVGLAGGTTLLAMGVSMAWTARRASLPSNADDDPDGGRIELGRIAAAGALTSLSNPYFPLWWATVGLSFLAQAAPAGPAGYAVFYTGHVLADLVWYSAVSESMHRGRRLLSDRGYRRLVGACGLLMAAFGVFFAVRGYGFLGGT
ncbi:MAG: LysE family transporter [Candidatus Brocadiaceae bacterium]|nr:LysE family transporter [Candidatus Brocadiaceae bacterium]